MLNLLPPEEKKKVRKEYRFRLALVISFFFLAMTVVAVVTLFPAYIIEKSEMMGVSKSGIDNATTTDVSTDSSTTKRIKELLPYLSARIVSIDEAPQVSETLKHVLDKRTSALTIATIKWNTEGIGVVGVARTRDDLIAFYKALKDDSFFKEVVFPIDDIAKSTNNDFTIELTF